MRRSLILCVLMGALAGQAPAQTREEADFVMDLFQGLQAMSFDKEREHCGFIGRDAQGALVASEATAGSRASCPLVWPRGMEVVASYHTHGAFDAGYFNELPSGTDMLSDQSLGVAGWIATPGGRLWYVDGERMVAHQVCGVGCLPTAPGFYKAQAGEVAKGYTYDELVRRLGG